MYQVGTGQGNTGSAAVLLVDDRPDDRELMSTLLGYAGYGVTAAESGEVALGLARDQRPDLIISDILMPGMNGYEFVRKLREDPELATIPVIFCTANYLENEVRDLAASCGVSSFISKPCPPEVMLATVAETLGQPDPFPIPVAPGPEFEREQLRVINDKLVEKVAELEYVSAHRRQLLGLVMSAQEDERHRIADGIHDDSLQSVVAVGLRLGAVRRTLQEPEAIETLESLQEAVKLAAQRLRSLLFELRPPELDLEGLAPALRSYLEHVRVQEGLEFALEDRLDSEPEPEMRAFLYRITQEALINTRKHAHASRVEVTITTRDGRYVILVRDDGIGFDAVDALRARPGHLGLAALTERLELAGGAVRIESAPGRGATVELELPTGDAPPVAIT
jgi:signal transduction histidine kinase